MLFCTVINVHKNHFLYEKTVAAEALQRTLYCAVPVVKLPSSVAKRYNKSSVCYTAHSAARAHEQCFVMFGIMRFIDVGPTWVFELSIIQLRKHCELWTHYYGVNVKKAQTKMGKLWKSNVRYSGKRNRLTSFKRVKIKSLNQNSHKFQV